MKTISTKNVLRIKIMVIYNYLRIGFLCIAMLSTKALAQDYSTSFWKIEEESEAKIVDIEENVYYTGLATNVSVAGENDQFYLVKEGGKDILYNRMGKLMETDKIETPTLYTDDFIVTQKGKVGLFNPTKNIRIPSIYDEYKASSFYMNYYVFKKNGKCGMVDSNNNIILDFVYDNISFAYDNRNNLLTARKNNIEELYDYKTKRLLASINCEYIDISETNGSRSLLVLKKNNKYGYINKRGKIVVPCEYDKVFDYNINEEWFYGIKNNKYDIFDNQGKLVLANCDKFFNCRIKSGKIIAMRNGVWGVYKATTHARLCKFSGTPHASNYNQGGDYIIVDDGTDRSGRLYGVMNANKCAFIIPIKYDQVRIDEENKYAACWNKNEMTNDIFELSTGRIVKSIANTNWEFGYGYWQDMGPQLVETGEKFGVVNHVGDWIISPKYDKGQIRIAFNIIIIKGEGIYNEQGKKIFSGDFDDVSDVFPIGEDSLSFDLYKNERRGYYNYLNGSVKEILPCLFDSSSKGEFKKAQYLYGKQLSDVDEDIPINNKTNNNNIVLIIANENYFENNISKVAFAHKDGDTFKDYCLNTLGTPQQNIKYIKDATLNQIRLGINWLNNITKTYDGEAKVIVYYSGHGMPDESSRNAYLVPSDGIANDYQSGYSLETLYKQLGELQTSKTIVLLDACFSGASRDGKMILQDSKGVIVKPKTLHPNGNTIVLSATQGDETAYPYKKKKHGMFTYFLLKKLQETKGEVSLGDLGTYINKQVRQNSIVENGKIQTPTISVSDKMSLIWKNLKIK